MLRLRQALALDPSLRDAERLRSLAHNALDLPRAWTIVGYGLIVVFLLTTHEVGHAWTAWKLAHDHMVVSFAGPGVTLVVCLAAFLLLVVACLGVRAAWPAAVSFQLARPFGPMAVAGLPSPRVVGGALFFVRELLFTSLALGCFNLLPVPPLDGSWILSGLLRGRGQALYEQLRRWRTPTKPAAARLGMTASRLA